MHTRLKKLGQVSPRTARWLIAAAVLIVLLFVAWLIWMVVSLSVTQSEAMDRIQVQQVLIEGTLTTNTEQDQALAEANRRLREVGGTPVVQPAAPAVGKQGAPGAQGPPGPPGPEGPRGTPGAQGDSAFDQWLAAGNDGDIDAFLASLVGPRGTPGTDGRDGATGATGPQGPAGPLGPAGPQGEKGATGSAGPTGPAGANAYPFTFRFTLPGRGPLRGLTYTCTVTDPAVVADCTTS